MALLQEETSLLEVVRLVGRDTLSDEDQVKLDTTKSIREDFLQQNAFHDVDTFCPLEKQFKMLDTILYFYDKCQEALEKGVYFSEIEKLDVKENIARMKYLPNDDLGKIDAIKDKIDSELKELEEVGDVDA